MIIRQIRLSNQAKDQLIRLKARTGIQQWNVLCRWALCASLAEPTAPIDVEIPADSNVEMTWHVFAGEYHEIYEALVIQRCLDDGIETTPANLARQFRLHLHRGITYLSSGSFVRSRADLINLALERSALASVSEGLHQ